MLSYSSLNTTTSPFFLVHYHKTIMTDIVLEEQFILRVPPEVAKQIHHMMKDNDLDEVEFSFKGIFLQFKVCSARKDQQVFKYRKIIKYSG